MNAGTWMNIKRTLLSEKKNAASKVLCLCLFLGGIFEKKTLWFLEEFRSQQDLVKEVSSGDCKDVALGNLS